MIFFDSFYAGKLRIVFQLFHFIGKVIITSVADGVVDDDDIIRICFDKGFPTCFCPCLVYILAGHYILYADKLENIGGVAFKYGEGIAVFRVKYKGVNFRKIFQFGLNHFQFLFLTVHPFLGIVFFTENFSVFQHIIEVGFQGGIGILHGIRNENRNACCCYFFSGNPSFCERNFPARYEIGIDGHQFFVRRPFFSQNGNF